MFNVRLAGGHLYGKQLFTWLSLVVSFMASFVLSFFPLDVLDGIWDLTESFSEGFLTYSCLLDRKKFFEHVTPAKHSEALYMLFQTVAGPMNWFENTKSV